jgi:hypothetical protein
MMAMPRWMRRTLGTLTLGGGAIGLVSVMVGMSQAAGANVWMVLLAFATIYAFGIWCGIAIFEERPEAAGINSIYWMLQVPASRTYWLSYFLSSGFHLTLWWPWNLWQTHFELQFGSVWNMFLFNAPETSMIGLNVFALAVVGYLRFRRQRSPAGIPAARPVVEEN